MGRGVGEEDVVTEGQIAKILEEAFEPAELVVEDVSGGCGSMFNIKVVTTAFEGKPLVQQQRMVNEVLKSEISSMHGLVLNTGVPKA